MQYSLSLTAFFVGFLVVAAGVAFVRFHRVIADNFGAGIASYDRYKLYALITAGLGFIIMLNLHTMILYWILSPFFSR